MLQTVHTSCHMLGKRGEFLSQREILLGECGVVNGSRDSFFGASAEQIGAAIGAGSDCLRRHNVNAPIVEVNETSHGLLDITPQ